MKEVYTLLDFNESTLHKYCSALENHNYSFLKSDQNRRLFFEKDIIVLRQLKQLNEQSFSLETAALIVVERFKGEIDQDKPVRLNQVSFIEERHPQQLSPEYTELQRNIDERMNEVNQAMRQLNAKETELLVERDKKLMNALNEALEKRKSDNNIVKAKSWFQKWFSK
ncbi:MAG: hypothetical protein ACI35P_16060 [Bacillus sp. (in: firmicutes)]